MADFAPAIVFTLEWEGGYVYDKDDPGGPTKCGITRSTLAAFRMRECYNDDVRDLSRAEILLIYRTKYWKHDPIVDQNVATKFFDLGVLFGPPRATMFIQEALCTLGVDIEVDANFGPLTLIAINNANPFKLINETMAVAIEHATKLVESRPALTKFYGGWLRRIKTWPTS